MIMTQLLMVTEPNQFFTFYMSIENIYMKPGSKVLYLGAANGTTISHVSDLVGETGIVYGVEISERSGRDLINMAKK